MTKCTHTDCLNFIPIDVAKGICHASGDQIVRIDTDTCSKFTAIAKCKFCKYFTDADEHNMGICEGFEAKDWTYGDLKTVTCEKFEKQ